MMIARVIDPARINDGRCFGEDCNAAYSLLAHLDPGLCVDVGAAIGNTTRRMLDNNPGSRVIAYEPYAGNHPHLAAAVGDDRRVTVRPVAVSDRDGSGNLIVPMPGDRNSGWARTVPGYSPLGHLSRAGDNGGTDVETVTLDEEIGEPVRFLKIDVQGGELAVLKGASRLMSGAGIDMIYIEFNGARPIAELLRANGYVLFDCAYMARPVRRYLPNWLSRRAAWRLPEWPVVDSGMLSTGSRYAYVWPHVPFRALTLYCVWFAACRLFLCGLQTDLLCIHERVLPALLNTLEQQA
ncbi:MAG: FkbM family methyltransferase [Sphingomonas sp.]